MPDPIIISRYQRSDRAEVMEFLPTAFPEPRAKRLIAQWDWKYDSFPFNSEPDPYILLMRDANKIIGMLGALSLRAFIRGEEYLISSGCDAIVHTSYRGRGLFARLIECNARDRRLGMGWGNSASNHIWADSTTGNFRVIPMIAPSFFHGYGLGRPPADARAAGKIEVIQIEKFDSRFDALWQSVRCDFPVAIIRDQRYLNWRYCERPDETYTRLCAVRGDELLGYIVVRTAWKEQARGQRIRLGYLVDWTVKGRSFETLSLLVRHAFANIRRQGVRFVSARTTTPTFRSMLHRLGFVSWYWGPREYAITQVALQDEKLQVLNDMRQWFSTMGDGDLEMSF